MSTTTNYLNLYKVNPSTDGNDRFSFQRFLNDNWDAIDADSKRKDTRLDAVESAVETSGGGSIFGTSYRGGGNFGASSPTTVTAPLLNGQLVRPASFKFMGRYGEVLEVPGMMYLNGNSWEDIGYIGTSSLVQVKARVVQNGGRYQCQIYSSSYAGDQFNESGDLYECVITFPKAVV